MEAGIYKSAFHTDPRDAEFSFSIVIVWKFWDFIDALRFFNRILYTFVNTFVNIHVRM